MAHKLELQKARRLVLLKATLMVHKLELQKARLLVLLKAKLMEHKLELHWESHLVQKSEQL